MNATPPHAVDLAKELASRIETFIDDSLANAKLYALQDIVKNPGLHVTPAYILDLLVKSLGDGKERLEK